jgi:hypothetical protein
LKVRPDEGPALQLEDNEGKVRGTFGVYHGLTSLAIYDSKRNVRTVLGVAELSNTRKTGPVLTAGSSLVLFDRERRVLWKTP